MFGLLPALPIALKILPPITLNPREPEFAGQVSTLPQTSGLYCLRVAGGEPHLAWSANLRRRLTRLFLKSAKGTPDTMPVLREFLRNNGSHSSEPADRLLHLDCVECWPTSSKLESSLLMYELARTFFPGDYERRLRLRLPWFVGIQDSDGFPRLMVTNRRGRRTNTLWGPFPSRESAEYYEQEVLRLYQVRRCIEPLRPSPEHPGCIYGEMNQCVRPCQCAVTLEEYAAEFGRVSDFLKSNGKATLSSLTAARASASENMEFERAAQIHKRMEQVKTAAAARDEVVAELGSLHGIAITRGPSSSEVRLWPMLEGHWQEPITIDVSAQQAQPRSMDADLKERLTNAAATSSTDGDPFEHLSLFLRWYRSSWRDGEWVQFPSLDSLNYRRLVREVSKLAKEAGSAEPTPV